MNPQKRSRQLFDSGLFCAESVLQTVAEYYEIKSGCIPKIATGFCSGLSRTNGLCGAVTGGILAINLLTGRNTPEITVEKNYQFVQEFLSRFKKRYSTILCSELIQCDISQPGGMKQFRDLRLIETCKQIFPRMLIHKD